MELIPLTLKDEVVAFAIIDDEDYESVSSYHWHLSKAGNGYAFRSFKGKPLLMHRQILGIEEDPTKHVDHINRSGLDNRKSNLRIVTHAQNRQNTSSHRGSSSKFRGVWRRGHKWESGVKHAGRNYYCGTFLSEEDAAEAASNKRKELLPFSIEN